MKVSVLGLFLGIALAMASPARAEVKSVVLVHGAFADGSGWKPVADVLLRDGYSVYVVQEPETTFAADVAATRRVLDYCVRYGRFPFSEGPKFGPGSSNRSYRSCGARPWRVHLGRCVRVPLHAARETRCS